MKERQINEIRNEKGGNTNDASVIKESLESIINNYVNKLDNLEETDKFLETYNLLTLNWDKIESRNRPITNKETESVI